MASILLIEDDDLFRETFATVLTEYGHAVTQAANGEQGVERFRTQPTDLVITDIVMPQKMGTVVVAELRGEFPRVGIIAMSGGLGYESELYLRHATASGANRTLLKPFSIPTLLQTIEEVLAVCGHQRTPA